MLITKAMLDGGKRVGVVLHCLRSSRGIVRRSEVKAALRKMGTKASAAVQPLPLVVRRGNVWTIVRGHAQLTAAWLLGRPDADVLLVEIAGKAGTHERGEAREAASRERRERRAREVGTVPAPA